MSKLKDLFVGDGTDGGRISAYKLWVNKLLELKYKDKSEKGPVRDKNFYASSSAIYSERDNVTYLYTIDGYPAQISKDFKEEIRELAYNNIRISYISLLEPTRIEWSSAKMRSRLRTWQQTKKREDEEDVDEFTIQDKLSTKDSMSHRSKTLYYLADADQRRRRKLFTYRTMVIISGTRGEDFDDVIEKVTTYCSNSAIRLTRVDDSIEEYLRAFSPFSMTMNDSVRNGVGNSTITDEVIARFSSYDQGKVGDGRVYISTDIDSGYPITKEFKKSETQAENYLISAETGGGKSYLVKGLIIQLIADPRINGTINDIEGDEYEPLANYLSADMSVVFLNMAEGSGSYYDPVEIMEVPDKNIAKDMYSLSRSTTHSILSTLMGEVPTGPDYWVNNIIRNIVTATYRDVGVSAQDMSTWSNSKGLTLQSVYRKFKSIRGSRTGGITGKYSDNEDYKKAMDIVESGLDEYFDPEGSQSHVFTKPISLKEVVDADLVVCSFGMRGRSQSSVDPVQMALSQVSAAHVSHLRSIFSKMNGKYNFKVWEEFQRWGNFPGSKELINTVLTGGRKMGDINIIATNKLSELLGQKDKEGLFQNITSFSIGGIADSKIYEDFCERLNIQNMIEELKKIVVPREKTTKKDFSLNEDTIDDDEDDSSSVGGDSKYKYAFLHVLDRSDVAMGKVELPETISDTDLLKTGVEVRREDNSSDDQEDDW